MLDIHGYRSFGVYVIKEPICVLTGCMLKVDALLAPGQLQAVQMLHFLHIIEEKYYMDHMR